MKKVEGEAGGVYSLGRCPEYRDGPADVLDVEGNSGLLDDVATVLVLTVGAEIISVYAEGTVVVGVVLLLTATGLAADLAGAGVPTY